MPMFHCDRKKVGKGSRAMMVVSAIYNLDNRSKPNKVPEHLKTLRIPPAWTNVTVDPDPEAKCWAKGFDVKGRVCSLYAPHHTKAASTAKFEKVAKLLKVAHKIEDKLTRAINKPGPPDVVVVAYLIYMMGLRPGSKTDTLADKQAYGATTLQARHVKRMGSGAIWLDFIGKKGVKIHLKVHDIRLGDLLFWRKQEANGGRITPLFDVSNSALNAYIKSLVPGCNPKDFRTLKANVVAAEFMEGKRIPKQKNKAKLLLRKLFIAVSKVLGNTPAIAKKSYVSPDIYQPLSDVIGAKP